MALSALVTQFTGWLRAGYPAGAPQRGYSPALALLPSRLSDAEIAALARNLTRGGEEPSERAIRAALYAATQNAPRDSDVDRVIATLTAAALSPPEPGPSI